MNAESVRCIDITSFIQGYFAGLLANTEEVTLEIEQTAFKTAIRAAIEKYSKQPIFKTALKIVLQQIEKEIYELQTV